MTEAQTALIATLTALAAMWQADEDYAATLDFDESTLVPMELDALFALLAA